MSLSHQGLLLPALALAFTATGLEAQQFVHIPAAFPGTGQWSEGVVCSDIDLDGDLDVLFANGEGFGSAGLKRTTTVLINQTIGSAGAFFSDESLARIGPLVSNAKSIACGDVTGDVYPELIIATA